MAKKLSMLMAAMAIIAFAVPAAASAATGLTMPEGTLVPTGRIVTTTNVLTPIVITSTRLGNISCEHMMMAAELVTNSASEVKATKGGEQSATGCSRAGAEVKVFGIELNELKTNGGGTAVASAAFQVELTPGGVVCKFVGTNDTFTYTPGGSEITVEKGAMSVTPAACGTSAALDGKFTMETSPLGGGGDVFTM